MSTGTNGGADRNGVRARGPRAVALVGPFQSGKTTLFESLLARSGALARQGSIREGTTAGDASAEARAHAMSVEPNIGSVDYLGDRYTFIDCPGSVEFMFEMANILPACDVAVVVCEADPRKAPALQATLRLLEDHGIPRILFLNKIDLTSMLIRDALQLLQPASSVPLLLRQIPLWESGVATGFIDLALERAFIYREHAPSTVIDVPAGEIPAEKEARYAMLERLADYDDSLMEELISDIEPPRDQVFDDLARDLRDGSVVPLLIGSAERGNGVTRLFKALRHEAPDLALARRRLGIEEQGPAIAHVMRTIHTAHGGKLSLARVMRGAFSEGGAAFSPRGEDRIAGLSRLTGVAATKQPRAEEGEVVAFGRLEHAATGDLLTDRAPPPPSRAAPVPAPVRSFALAVKDRKDDVRLAAAMAKLKEEDPSLVFEQDQESGETRLHGQGEMHLRIALERLASRFGVSVEARKPGIAYRETIRAGVNVRGRHKKQSGGHGQFGDVVLTIEPLARGEGFRFSETVHGGAVPRNYFAAVEAGCRDALMRGPLGFPVVDVAVTLTDGSYHTVDSSDMAFRLAAKVGVSEGLAKAKPVLLEPIMGVDVVAPSEAIARASALLTARRGQILGFDGRPGWKGWDVLRALVPEAEIGDLIVELRSVTAGVGSYEARFDHLAELVGRPAEQAVAQARTRASA